MPYEDSQTARLNLQDYFRLLWEYTGLYLAADIEI
jgi:hypothetical protein